MIKAIKRYIRKTQINKEVIELINRKEYLTNNGFGYVYKIDEMIEELERERRLLKR